MITANDLIKYHHRNKLADSITRMTNLINTAPKTTTDHINLLRQRIDDAETEMDDIERDMYEAHGPTWMEQCVDAIPGQPGMMQIMVQFHSGAHEVMDVQRVILDGPVEIRGAVRGMDGSAEW